MYNDVYGLGIIEQLVRWIEQCPRASAEFRRRNASGWHVWPNSEFKRWLMAYWQRADITTPRGRRFVRQCMDEPAYYGYFNDDDRWRVSENSSESSMDTVDVLRESSQVEEPVLVMRRTPGLSRSLACFGKSPVADDECFISRKLASCLNPPEACRVMMDVFPVFKKETHAYGFLATVGYPCGVPTEAVRIAMGRIGWGGAEGDAITAAQYHDIIARIKAGTGYTPAAISLLFTVLVNEEPWRCYAVSGGCKGVSPLCSHCVLNGMCEKSLQPVTLVQVPEKGTESDVAIMMNDLPESDKPREKLLVKGQNSLEDYELLAILLRVGAQGCSVLDLSKKIIKHYGSLHKALSAGAADLAKFSGLGPAKAATVIAALELGRRAFKQSVEEKADRAHFNDARVIFEAYRHLLYDKVQELFIVIALDTKLRKISETTISQGTLNRTVVSPRDVFRFALREAAYGVICMHNHPSGDPTPSTEDRTLTDALSKAGGHVGVKLLDHIVIGNSAYYSFREHGVLID